MKIQRNSNQFRSVKKLVFVAALFIITTANAKAKFVEDHYEHIRQEGRVHVECNDGFNPSYNSFWCEGSFLAPDSSAYFESNKPEGFHHVLMTIQNSTGTVTDTWKLNPLNGKTWLPISLWGRNGILSLGANAIRYSIQAKDDSTLEDGSLQVDVTESPVRECRPIWIRSGNSFDCQMPGYACQQLSFERSECR